MGTAKSNNTWLQQWSFDLIGLLFTNLCNASVTPLISAEHLICTKCLYDLPFTDYHHHPENIVAKQLWRRLPINAAMAMLYFRKGAKVQKLIHNLKYNGRTEVGISLGNLLAERLKNAAIYQDIDLMLPVPPHQKKLKLRGYNQSTFIAEGVSAKMEVSFAENILVRAISTESQTRKIDITVTKI